MTSPRTTLSPSITDMICPRRGTLTCSSRAICGKKIGGMMNTRAATKVPKPSATRVRRPAARATRVIHVP